MCNETQGSEGKRFSERFAKWKSSFLTQIYNCKLKVTNKTKITEIEWTETRVWRTDVCYDKDEGYLRQSWSPLFHRYTVVIFMYAKIFTLQLWYVDPDDLVLVLISDTLLNPQMTRPSLLPIWSDSNTEEKESNVCVYMWVCGVEIRSRFRRWL